MRRALHLAVTLIAFAGYAGPVLAEEGMWTFDNFPADKVKQQYGITIDKAWLDHVQGASMRLSTGCSASIVGAASLVLTNNHCVRNCEQQLSTPGTDYVKNGFLAATGREERECAGMQAEVLHAITDVTAQVNGAAAGAYDGTLNRSVVVSTASITEALQKVYGASALVNELGS